MDTGTIIVIIVAAIILGIGVYFQATGKKNIAKSIWTGLGGFIVAMGAANIKKISKIKQKSQDAIDNSKKNDKDRTEITNSNEERIKKNEDLLEEINKVLNDD